VESREGFEVGCFSKKRLHLDENKKMTLLKVESFLFWATFKISSV
jgi:hypothetical protein